MFAKVLTSAAAVLFCCAQVSWAQTSSSHGSHKTVSDDESGPASVVPVSPAIVGTWHAQTERLPLTGDFNEKVWGKNAVSLRDVTLAVKSNGEGTLTVSKKVLDARGRVVPGSPSIEQADIMLGEAKPGLATRVDHDVRVVKAERRYPDNAGDKWPLENLRVSVVSFTDAKNDVEVRFEPADGNGSFSETLTRAVARPTRK
jgi:hypothetical protein